MPEAAKVCPDCATEATRVAGRRRGTGYWWCWRCEKAIRPIAALNDPRDRPRPEPTGGER
jgi:ribosomal protein L37AE/L43A